MIFVCLYIKKGVKKMKVKRMLAAIFIGTMCVVPLVGCQSTAPKAVIDGGMILDAQLENMQQDMNIIVTAYNSELKKMNSEFYLEYWLPDVEARLLAEAGNSGMVNLEDYKAALGSAMVEMDRANAEYDAIADALSAEFNAKAMAARRLNSKIAEYNRSGGASQEQFQALLVESMQFAREMAEVRSQRQSVVDVNSGGFDFSRLTDVIRDNALESVLGGSSGLNASTLLQFIR